VLVDEWVGGGKRLLMDGWELIVEVSCSVDNIYIRRK
jgi:hypothetical protein